MTKGFFSLIACAALAIAISSCSKGGGGGSTPPPPPPPTPTKTYYTWDNFVMGSDISYVNAIEDNGGSYKDSGNTKDLFTILKNHGGNTIRVRLWHDPQWEATVGNGKLYNGLQDAEKTIQRAKVAGMAVNLDLHYSDTWADPGHQTLPTAWNGLVIGTLKDSVYNYTLSVLNELKSKNLTPEMIQVGNETNGGMLWPTGQIVSDNWTNFGILLNSAIKAVRDFSASSTIKPQIIMHVAQLQNADWYANGLINKASVTDFDILGISHYYPYTTYSSMNDVSGVISSLKSKYGKKVMIVETAYPWTSANADSYPNIQNGATGFGSYAVSKDGQYQYMKDLTQQIIAGGGSGIMYWEPEWITSSYKDPYGTGSSWDNNTFFDFTGNTIAGIDYMTFSYKF